MRLITVPVHLLVRLVVLPIKLALAAVGLTFRLGFKAGAMPVKGGVVAGRALGLKALVVLALGVAAGVAVGRRLGSPEASSSYEPGFSPVSRDGDESVTVEDTVTVAETEHGVAVVEDVVVTEQGPNGTVVTETITVDELEVATVDADLDPETAALDAEVSHVLGETAGESPDGTESP